MFVGEHARSLRAHRIHAVRWAYDLVNVGVVQLLFHHGVHVAGGGHAVGDLHPVLARLRVGVPLLDVEHGLLLLPPRQLPPLALALEGDDHRGGVGGGGGGRWRWWRWSGWFVTPVHGGAGGRGRLRASNALLVFGFDGERFWIGHAS